MLKLYPKLREADAILLDSPAYMGGVASRMQAFMERGWPLRKGSMAGTAGSHIITGSRQIRMAASSPGPRPSGALLSERTARRPAVSGGACEGPFIAAQMRL